MQIKKVAIQDRINRRKKRIGELTNKISELMKENQKDEEEIKKIL